MATIILNNNEEKELWKSVAAAVASSSNVTRTYKMSEWADKAVELYRERLKNKA